MKAKNPQYNAAGTIDLEIEHPQFGWIPFTASEHDDSGRELYARALAGEFGQIAPYIEPPPPPITVELIANAVQSHLDATARAIGYDDIRSAVTYADEPAVPRFQADGIKLRRWRSLVWAKCYELLAQVEAGKLEPLTPAQVIELLPEAV